MMITAAAGLVNIVGHWHMTDTVTIERPTVSGWELVAADVAANVQQPRGDTSKADRQEARTTEYSVIVVYTATVLPDTPAVGYRVTHHGARYLVDVDQSERTHARVTKLVCAREQLAVAPEVLTFTRRGRSGVATTVGTWPCQVTLDRRGGYDVSLSGSGDDDQTARGDVNTGVIVITDPAAAAIKIGDRFTRGDLPGEIMTADRDDPQRLEYGFRLERVTA